MADALFNIVNSGWFGALLGLLLAVLAYIASRRQRQHSELRDMLGEVELIGVTPTEYSDGLEVLFEGERIPQVTSATYAIWNAGNTTLHGRDIVDRDPLRLELQGEGRVLRAELETATRDVNSAWVGFDDKAVKLSFDYLDPSDGFRVSVLHSAHPKSLTVAGTIKGLPKGVIRHDPSRGFWIGVRAFVVVMFALMFAMFGWLAYFVVSSLLKGELKSSLPLLVLSVAFFVGIPLVTWWDRKKKVVDKTGIAGMPDKLSEGARFYVWPSISSQMGSNPYGSD